MSEVISFVLQIVYQYGTNASLLILSAVGLMVIFGMMGVINMAHGELMMIGAYVTTSSYYVGFPLPLAIVAGALGAGVVGVVLERILIRRFYHHLLMSLVVTWGLSLFISQGALRLLGPYRRSVPAPRGTFHYHGYTYSDYRVITFCVAMAVVAGLWLLCTRTRYGIRARATMENAAMAKALGVRTSTMYALTFGLGAALAGLAGGMFAPMATVGPFFGQNYTPQAFVTVVVGGGANIVSGLLAGALLLGGVRALLASQFSVLIAYFGMLVTAFLVIRFAPAGISAYLERRKLGARPE